VYETGQVKPGGVGNTSPLRRGIAPGAGRPCTTPTGIPNRRGDASRLEAMRRPHTVNRRARHSENRTASRKPARCPKRGWSNQVASGMPRPYDVESHPVPAGRARRPPASQIVGATHRRNRRTIIVANRTRNLGTQTGAILAMRRPHTVNRRARHSAKRAASRKPARCPKRGWSNQVASGMPRPYDVELHPVPVGRARRPPASQIAGATHRVWKRCVARTSSSTRRARHSENQATSRKLARCTKRGGSS
jgi:hypothetical protein